jgi:hypothetical protein
MRLLDMPQEHIYQALVTIIKGFILKLCGPFLIFKPIAGDQKISPGVFWTSASDAGSEGTFGFGLDRDLLPQDAQLFQSKRIDDHIKSHYLFRWQQGQPDDFNQSQNCLAVNVMASSYGFVDEQCSSLQRYN